MPTTTANEALPLISAVNTKPNTPAAIRPTHIPYTQSAAAAARREGDERSRRGLQGGGATTAPPHLHRIAGADRPRPTPGPSLRLPASAEPSAPIIVVIVSCVP